MPASELWSFVEINRRSEDKDEGYQRALSPSRVRQVSKFIQTGGVIPGSIIISIDKAVYDSPSSLLTFDDISSAGWVIDGQHRLAGAHDASKEGKDIVLSVVAFVGLSVPKQVEHFITINREAKGVSASLYIDLLKHLPRQKSEKELSEERVADIAKNTNTDDTSPFYQRIVATRKPGRGEISLVNFTRIVRPLIAKPSGIISLYTPIQQQSIIDNYYSALQAVFKKPYKDDLFFKTLGFGGVWRAFPYVFNRSLTDFKGFTVKNVADVLRNVADFDFASWNQMGTGSAAEIQAGDDLLTALAEAYDTDGDGGSGLKL